MTHCQSFELKNNSFNLPPPTKSWLHQLKRFLDVFSRQKTNLCLEKFFLKHPACTRRFCEGVKKKFRANKRKNCFRRIEHRKFCAFCLCRVYLKENNNSLVVIIVLLPFALLLIPFFLFELFQQQSQSNKLLCSAFLSLSIFILVLSPLLLLKYFLMCRLIRAPYQFHESRENYVVH